MAGPNSEAVAVAFMNRKSEQSGSFSTNGRSIRSYDWTLAEWSEDGKGNLILCRPAYVAGYLKHTATTNRHTSALRRVLEWHGWPMPHRDVALVERPNLAGEMRDAGPLTIFESEKMAPDAAGMAYLNRR